MIHKHPSLLYFSDISDICKSLKKMDITYFAHVHIDKESRFSALSNHAVFSEHYLTNKYYHADIHMVQSEKLGDFVVWDAIDCDGESAKMDQEGIAFGIRHTFTLIKRSAQGSDFYHFATDYPHKSINQVYLANMDLLNLFILHFQDEVSHSHQLLAAYQMKFDIEQNTSKYIISQQHEQANMTTMRSEFLRALKQPIKSQPSIDEIKQSVMTHYLLSSREFDCLYLATRGLPVKQVAAQLNISPRTAEEHLNNAKIKLGVYSKAELISRALDLFTPAKGI